jgi:hypothetical protein
LLYDRGAAPVGGSQKNKTCNLQGDALFLELKGYGKVARFAGSRPILTDYKTSNSLRAFVTWR